MNMKPQRQQQQSQAARATAPVSSPSPVAETVQENASPLTANESREFRRLAAGGASVADLASQFGRPASMIERHLGKGR